MNIILKRKDWNFAFIAILITSHTLALIILITFSYPLWMTLVTLVSLFTVASFAQRNRLAPFSIRIHVSDGNLMLTEYFGKFRTKSTSILFDKSEIHKRMIILHHNGNLTTFKIEPDLNGLGTIITISSGVVEHDIVVNEEMENVLSAFSQILTLLLLALSNFTTDKGMVLSLIS